MRRSGLIALLVLLCAAPLAAQRSDRLREARDLYNNEHFAAAIAAATAAQADAAIADAASVILARAHLERYRLTRDDEHLVAAREALRAVDVSRLTRREEAEFTVGLAEWLFLDDRFGAAAELFDTALGPEGLLEDQARDRVLDWWATSIDRHAQVTPPRRQSLYQQVIDRAEAELRRRPGSVAAGYWLVAAARGLGDLDRAWNAAVAGWLRARTGPDHGAALRADLDRLVQAAIIPERARELASDGGDSSAAAQALTAEWEELKAKWQ